MVYSHVRFLISATLAGFGLASCGPGPASSLKFLPASQPNLVTVEASDLADHFLFGAIVTDTDAAASAIAGASAMLAEKVQLKVEEIGGDSYLSIASEQDGQRLLAFKVSATQSQTTLVDFAASASAVAVLSVIDPSVAAGAKAAKVSSVAQSKDAMTVDVAYTGDIPNADGGVVSGHYSVRYWWKRRVANPDFAVRSNIDGLGYFTTSPESADLKRLRLGNISRLDLSRGPLSFTLVDVPPAYVEAVTSGITAWEKALGQGTIDVKVGSGNVGDPSTIVVRWYRDLPESVQFAGLTYAAAAPDTGERGASAVLLNGTVEKIFRDRFAATQKIYQAFKADQGSPAVAMAAAVASADVSSADSAASQTFLRVGKLELHRNALMQDRAEFMPGLLDQSEDVDTYLTGYIRSVVMHEVGHVMGLRHNFRASLITDADTEQASSIMDYADNQNGDKAVVIGSYDLAAIRYGYYGESFPSGFEYCSDEDQDHDALCNQFDDGKDVATYLHLALQQTIHFASRYDFKPEAGFSGVKTQFGLYHKLATLPWSGQAQAAAMLKADQEAIASAVGNTPVQQANLELLRKRALILSGQATAEQK